MLARPAHPLMRPLLVALLVAATLLAGALAADPAAGATRSPKNLAQGTAELHGQGHVLFRSFGNGNVAFGTLSGGTLVLRTGALGYCQTVAGTPCQPKRVGPKKRWRRYVNVDRIGVRGATVIVDAFSGLKAVPPGETTPLNFNFVGVFRITPVAGAGSYQLEPPSADQPWSANTGPVIVGRDPTL